MKNEKAEYTTGAQRDTTEGKSRVDLIPIQNGLNLTYTREF